MRKIGVLFSGIVLTSMVFLVFPFAYAEKQEESLSIEIKPSFLSVGIIGDKAKFEEDNWTSRNSSGGIEHMSFSKKLSNQDTLDFEGRAILGNNDYDAELNLAREGIGSLTFEFKEFSKYFDGTGGYYENFQTTNFHPAELNNSPRLIIGDFKVEGILARENSPEYSIGYEREFREGSKSLISWGPLTNGTTTRYLNPTYIDLSETVDKLMVGIKKVTSDSEMSAKQTWEAAKGDTSKINNKTTNIISGSSYNYRRKFETTDSDLYTTQLMFSKDLNKSLFMSCGLLYNRYVGGSMERITDTSDSAYNENHPLNPATVKQDTVTFMPNVSFKPLKDLVVGAGFKAEFEAKHGEATYNRDYRTAAPIRYTPDGIVDELVNIYTSTEKKKFSENIQFKYNRVKNTVFYGNADFEKQFISQFEVQDAFGPNFSASSAFSRKTNTVADAYSFTLGSKWYPVSKVNITVQDKYREKTVDNRNEFLTGDVVGGLRGYIDTMKLVSNVPSLRLNYKPLKWLSGSFGYIYDKGIYAIRTRAGSSTEVARYRVETYSADLTFTPADYFYCSLFYERRNDCTSVRSNGAGGATIATQLPDYKANVDILGLDYSYALCKDTAVTGGYSMYFSDNFNDFSSTGIPLGLNNLSQKASLGVKHSLNKDRSVEVKYSYQNYAEDSNNHVDDYEAHIGYLAMNMAF